MNYIVQNGQLLKVTDPTSDLTSLIEVQKQKQTRLTMLQQELDSTTKLRDSAQSDLDSATADVTALSTSIASDPTLLATLPTDLQTTVQATVAPVPLAVEQVIP